MTLKHTAAGQEKGMVQQPRAWLGFGWVMALEICFANLLKQKNNLSSPEVSQHLPDKSQLRTQSRWFGNFPIRLKGSKIDVSSWQTIQKVLVFSVL